MIVIIDHIRGQADDHMFLSSITWTYISISQQMIRSSLTRQLNPFCPEGPTILSDYITRYGFLAKVLYRLTRYRRSISVVIAAIH